MSDPPKKENEPPPSPPPPAGENKQYFDDTPGAKKPTDWTKSILPTFSGAFKMIQVDDFGKVHKQICVRDALLVGIAAGFGFGGIRLMLKSTVKSASNWAVGTFCGGSITSYEMCQLRRGNEIEGMLKAKYLMEKKMAEKKQKEELARLEAERKAIEDAKRWWKPWTWRT